jgi:uncharacterized protein YutE (UPF0331/DUF86 family)
MKTIMRAIIEALRRRRLLPKRDTSELAEHIKMFNETPHRYFEADDHEVIFE